MDLIFFNLIISILFLVAVVFIYFLNFKSQKKITHLNVEFREKEKLLEDLRIKAEKQALVAEERYNLLKIYNDNQNAELIKTREDNLVLTGRLEKSMTEYINLREKLQTQKAEMEDVQKKFTIEFENIAGKILKKNSEDFTLTNQKNIGEVLTPLKEKILLFEKRVEDTYLKGLKDQTDLRAELKKLYDLNNQMSTEAQNLTRALKGDVKKQGNWGEIVLERILERSGLNEGEQGFIKQYSHVSDNGKRLQPDIVINLPDNKHIIIDSKVSLIAYERSVNAASEEERLQHVKDHLISLKSHIRGLSDKHYQSAPGLNCPDFVLMFIPIESSFSLAVQADHDLFSFAWDLKVVLVSPSTLLATLRTVSSIWKQENQTRNALEIARQSGALYDKFVGFIGDMEKIGNNLRITQNSYSDAMKKLSEGRGNLVNATERIRKLGAKATKEIPKKLLHEKERQNDDFSEETIAQKMPLS